MRPAALLLGVGALLVACNGPTGGNEPAPQFYRASVTVGLDSIIDSMEVQLPDTVVFVRAGELSPCIVWDGLTSAQSISFRVWDDGQVVHGWGGDTTRTVSVLPWDLTLRPHVRAWGQQWRYEDGTPVPRYYTVGYTRVTGECSGIAG